MAVGESKSRAGGSLCGRVKVRLVFGCMGGTGFVFCGVIAWHLFFDLSLAMRSQLLKGWSLQPPLPPLLASLRNEAAVAFA